MVSDFCKKFIGWEAGSVVNFIFLAGFAALSRSSVVKDFEKNLDSSSTPLLILSELPKDFSQISHYVLA